MQASAYGRTFGTFGHMSLLAVGQMTPSQIIVTSVSRHFVNKDILDGPRISESTSHANPPFTAIPSAATMTESAAGFHFFYESCFCKLIMIIKKIPKFFS